MKKVNIKLLKGNGDFRSDECREILEKADIVVTNPPFSLFREFIVQLVEYEKKFIVIGNGNAVKYNEIFPLIQKKQIWLGVSKKMGGSPMMFLVNEDFFDAEKGTANKVKDGKCYVGVMMCCWFCNVEHNKENKMLVLTRHYNEKDYPKYENYDAINVDRVCDIPMDYDGIMGVPISFLDKYNPNQFEIIGRATQPRLIGGECKYTRFLIKRR